MPEVSSAQKAEVSAVRLDRLCTQSSVAIAPTVILATAPRVVPIAEVLIGRLPPLDDRVDDEDGVII